MKKLLVLVVAIALGWAVASAQFDGQPTSPQPFVNHPDYANFDVQVHSRSAATWGDNSLESIQAQHGADCSSPPASHENHSYSGAVYVCNDHVMTALNASEYGLIYLTPSRLLDCTSTCTVQWEMSTERMSQRDWPDLWVTPYEYNLALPFDSTDPDLQGPPQRAIHVTFNTSQFAPVLSVIQNQQIIYENYDSGPQSSSPSEGIATGTNQAATRQTLKLTLSPGHVKFERLASATASALVMFDVTTPPLPLTNSMVVQFGQHSYTPTKDNSGVPATWHWDNFTLSPSTPFTLIHGSPRRVTNGVVTFTAPAPANAFLRFSAVGRVTVNGTLVSPAIPTLRLEHHTSYFVPIAAGTLQVSIQADNAKDFSIWSKGGSSSTPIPSATATSTSTLVPATPTPLATSFPTATASPVVTATPTTTIPSTATPASTSTPLPTRTSTPAAQVCRLRVQYGPASAPLEGFVDQPLTFCAGAHP